MKYTVFLTQQPTRRWQAVMPSWPNCLVEADTKAEAIHNIEQLALTLLRQSEVIQLELPIPPMLEAEQNGWQLDDDDGPTLEEVMAKIKATPPNPAAIHPATESLLDYLLSVPDDPDFDEKAWNRDWARVEAAMKARDRANDMAEGLWI